MQTAMTRKGVVHAVFVKVWVPIALAALTMNDRCASKALQMPAQSPGGSANANPARCIFLQDALPITKFKFDLPVLHPTQNYPNRRNLREAD